MPLVLPPPARPNGLHLLLLLTPPLSFSQEKVKFMLSVVPSTLFGDVQPTKFYISKPISMANLKRAVLNKMRDKGFPGFHDNNNVCSPALNCFITAITHSDVDRLASAAWS